MKPDITQLLAALDAETPELDALIEALQQQRQRLLGRDISGILESIGQQERLMAAVQTRQQERLQAMQAVAGRLALDRRSTLEALCACLSRDEATPVMEKRQALRQRVETVQRLNGDNQRLIRQALDAVRNLAAAVSGTTPARPVYEQTGRVRTPDQLRALIDQTT